MRVLYTPESIGDLQRLREFIEIKNPQAAQRIAKSIIKGISQLKTLPLLGIEVDKAPNPEMVRDLIIGSYIVRYLVGSEINILRVWHHKEKRL